MADLNPGTLDLVDRVALVTGSSSGIGEATARRLSALGARVIINSSSSVEAGLAVAESLSNDAVYVQADISDAAQAQSLIEAALNAFGRLDILVNNAAWTTSIPHHDLDALTDEIFERTFSVNVTGTWRLTKLAIPHLRQSSDGNVVSVTSVAGIRPMGSSIAYSMTKASLNHMTKLLAKAFPPIRFNAVAPGLVDTPWTADWQEVHAMFAEKAPLRRSASPQDCATAITSLVLNPYITGHVLVVDGGASLVM